MTATEIERPRRLTLSQILEMVLARRTAVSGVTLTRTASGDTQIDVQVRLDDNVTTVEDAERKALEVYGRISELYPHRSGHDNSSVTLSRNAKGETQIEVVSRTSDGLATVDEASAKAVDVYDKARMAYPMANGLTAKPGSVS